jgi:hypothetical protein
MDSSAFVKRNPQVVAQQLAEPDGAVLLHLDTGAYHGLNQLGLIVWELIETEQLVGDVIEGVRGRVLDPPPQVGDDVLRFLEMAADRNLVIVTEPSAQPLRDA